MVGHWPVIVGLGQIAHAVVWGSPLHAWIATMNLITWTCYRNTHYSYEARSMHNPITLPQYSWNYYTQGRIQDLKLGVERMDWKI